MRIVAVEFVGAAAAEILRAGHLVFVVEIVEDVEDGIVLRDVFDQAVGKNALHGLHEDGPFLGAVKVVAHEEAAAVEEFAHLFDL